MRTFNLSDFVLATDNKDLDGQRTVLEVSQIDKTKLLSGIRRIQAYEDSSKVVVVYVYLTPDLYSQIV